METFNKIWNAIALNAVPIVTGILQWAVGNTSAGITALASGIGGVVTLLIRTETQKTRLLGGAERRISILFLVLSIAVSCLISLIFWFLR